MYNWDCWARMGTAHNESVPESEKIYTYKSLMSVHNAKAWRGAWSESGALKPGRGAKASINWEKLSWKKSGFLIFIHNLKKNVNARSTTPFSESCPIPMIMSKVSADDFHPNWECLVDFFSIDGRKNRAMAGDWFSWRESVILSGMLIPKFRSCKGLLHAMYRMSE